MSENLAQLPFLSSEKTSIYKDKLSNLQKNNSDVFVKKTDFSEIVKSFEPKQQQNDKPYQPKILSSKSSNPSDKISSGKTSDVKDSSQTESSVSDSKEMKSKDAISEDTNEQNENISQILDDDTMSLEEKIAALLDDPQFASKTPEEKQAILTEIFENNPELKQEISEQIVALLADKETSDTVSLEEDSDLSETDNQQLDASSDKEKSADELLAIMAVVVEAPLLPKDIQAKLAEDSDILATAIDTSQEATTTDTTTEATTNTANTEIKLPQTTDTQKSDTKSLGISETKSEPTEKKEDIALEEKPLTEIKSTSDANDVKPADLSKDNSNLLPKDTQVQNQIQKPNHPLDISKEIKPAVTTAHTIPLENNVSLIITRPKDNPEQIGINLEPAGMGEAELIIENRDKVVVAIVRSEKPETLDMIRKESASLEKYLQESGLNLSGGGLQFERKSGQDTQDNNEQGEKTVHSVSMNRNSSPNYVVSETSIYQKLESINLNQGVDVRL